MLVTKSDFDHGSISLHKCHIFVKINKKHTKCRRVKTIIYYLQSICYFIYGCVLNIKISYYCKDENSDRSAADELNVSERANCWMVAFEGHRRGACKLTKTKILTEQ